MNRIPGVAIAMLLMLQVLVPVASAKDLTGDEIIRNVQHTYEKMKTLRATFRHEFIWSMADESEVSQGTMLLSGDDKFRYDTDNELIVSDGTTIWRYNRGSQQIIVENLKDADPGSLPRDFLFTFPNDFNPGSVKALPDDKYELTLLPKDDSLGVKNVKVIIDGKTWITTRLSFEDDAGNTTVYELESYELNTDIDLSSFESTPPANATVFDLR